MSCKPLTVGELKKRLARVPGGAIVVLDYGSEKKLSPIGEAFPSRVQEGARMRTKYFNVMTCATSDRVNKSLPKD